MFTKVVEVRQLLLSTFLNSSSFTFTGDLLSSVHFRVISDPNLSMPVRLGIIGEWGAGKSKIIKGVLWCLRQACDTTCTHLSMYSALCK